MKKLGDICDIKMGQSPSSNSYNAEKIGLPFFQGNADFGSKYPCVRLYCSAPIKVANKGDVLFSVRAPIGAINIAEQLCCIGRGLAALTPKNSTLEYLYFLLKAKSQILQSIGTGSTFKAITKISLFSLPIPDHSVLIQNQITQKLSLLEKLINEREEQVKSFDMLAKSRFLEMFGDPVLNPYGFDVKNMGEVCTFYTGTGFPNVFQGKSDGDFPFYKVGDISKNVQNGFKELEYCDNYINKDVVDKIRGTIIPSGTIVFAKIGEALKLNRRGLTIKNCLVDNNAMGVKPKEELNISYFFQLMKDLDMEKYSASTTVPSVRKTILERIPILVPNLDIQNKYAEFIKQLDKSKFRIKKSLEKLELTYNALLQEYFG